MILFTSGTSARPKGVVLNFREHLGNIDPTADGFGITARRPHLRFPLVQLGLGAASGRAGAAQPRRDAGDGGEILGQPLLPHMSASTASRSPPAIRPPSTSCSTASEARASRQPAVAALHHVELGAAHGRGMAAVRGALRHSDRAGLRLERDRLDRRHPRRAAPLRHRRTAASPTTTSPSSTPRAAGCRPGEIGQVEIGGFAEPRLPLSRRRRQRAGQQPRPHPHRRPRAARRRRVSAASPAARRS